VSPDAGVRRATLLVVALVVLAACGSSDPGGSSDASPSGAASTSVSAPEATNTTEAPAATATTIRTEFPPGTFDSTDALLDARVRAAGLPGGTVLVVAADGTVLHEHSVGSVAVSTPLAVASSTKWLTAAALMTFVDQDAIGLDDDIARWLPEFAGSSPSISPRQLLSHTSGVRDHPCQGDGTPLDACVRTLAASPREFPAGAQFSYGNAPFHVVGRLVEVLGGSDFATVVKQRLTDPLGMGATTWPGAPAAANPAFGAQVTVDDYAKLLRMLLNEGQVNGTRVLSADAVSEIVAEQVRAFDTTHDYSVGITGIPRYGLGCWRDVEDQSGNTVVASGNGGKGMYPWIDFATRTYGVVGVQDDRGAEVAVPASQVVAVEARRAVAS
jgi:CubicO group peptidase (beta-lactamase class C family)